MNQLEKISQEIGEILDELGLRLYDLHLNEVSMTLRVFIDKSMVEVFANDRQATAFAHKHIRENPNIRLFAKGGDAAVKSVKAWKIRSIYHGPAELE